MKKIIIAAAGSGGHLIPAQALAEQLQAAGVDVLFAGHGLKDNPFFDRSSFAYREIVSSPLTWKAPWMHLRGMKESLMLLAKFRPHKVVGFGSWMAAPMKLAALASRTPLLLFAPDVIPGKSLRWLSTLAPTAVYHFEAARHLRGSSVLVDWPLRKAFDQPPSREQARHYFGLHPQLRTVLVFGGSQGAKALNEQVPALLSSLRCQVIHLTGTAKQVEGVEFAYKSRQVVAVVKPFEMHMEMAWAAADQAICRAGALTIAEQMHMQVPAVYIPYPYAADQHQRANAHEAEAMGLGHVLKEEQLPCLLDVLRTLPTKETLQHSLRAWQKERKALIAEVLA